MSRKDINKIVELMSNIQEINNKFISEKFIGNKDFIKFNQKIEVQLKTYNDKINDILAKQSLNDETLIISVHHLIVEKIENPL